MTAAVKHMASRSGTPWSLSMSGSMPENPHIAPATMAVSCGTP